MRKLSFSAAVAAIIVSAFASVPATQPAEAMVIYQWCAHYGGRGDGGGTNCGFVTRAQCMAAVSGMMGFCNVNPWWQDPPPNARRARRG